MSYLHGRGEQMEARIRSSHVIQNKKPLKCSSGVGQRRSEGEMVPKYIKQIKINTAFADGFDWQAGWEGKELMMVSVLFAS